MQRHPLTRKTNAVLIPIHSTPAVLAGKSVPSDDQHTAAENIEAKRAKYKPKENRTRANKTKVRTGCITCKIRRVKCDERSDGGCARCEKLGVKCDGYLVPTKKDKPPVRAILPKLRTTTQQDLTNNAGVVEPISEFGLLNMLHGTGPQFSEEREYRYFRLYCEEVAPFVNGPMDPSIWSNVIPQASEKEKFIVHAMVALGALSKAGEITPSPKETRALPASSHLQYALAQYGKALSAMRKSLTGKQEDIRKAVIGCLLIFCFESRQSNEFIATKHACQIMELIREAKTKHISCGNFQLEEDFYALLSGLDIHSLLYFDERPSHIHRIYKEALSSKIYGMPEKLTTLEECRFYSQVLMRRNFHFTAETVPMMEPPLDGALSRSILLSIDVYATSIIPPSLVRECDQYVQDIQRWERASEPVLLREVQRDDTSSFAFIISNLLYIHASMTFITLVETFYPGDRSYDGHLPRFRTIVSRAAAIYQQLTASRTSTPVFRFDIGIIPALSLTGMLCRHSKVRREAIELLQKVPNYREGIWQSRACAMVADWIREIEEEFMDEYGFIPRNRRASLSSCKLGFHERWGKMTARQRDGTDGGGFVMREKILRW